MKITILNVIYIKLSLRFPSVPVPAGILAPDLESFEDLLKERYPIPRRLLGKIKRTTLEIAPTTGGSTSSKTLCWDSDNEYKQSMVFLSKHTITPSMNTARKP